MNLSSPFVEAAAIGGVLLVFVAVAAVGVAAGAIFNFTKDPHTQGILELIGWLVCVILPINIYGSSGLSP